MRAAPRYDGTRLQRLASDALAAGAEHPTPTTLRWDISGRCEAPKAQLVGGRELPKLFDGSNSPREWSNITSDGEFRSALWVELTVPCRRCRACLRQRARIWRDRAKMEFQLAERTWFGTLTLRPEAHYEMLCRARHNCPDFDGLDFEGQFKRRHSEISKEITKYLKRVRKQSGAKIRYLLVAEEHKSGLPHYHLLVHEGDAACPVRYDVLKYQWPHGFSAFKLADEKTAGYVTKYLMKSACARVRASQMYGTVCDHSDVRSVPSRPPRRKAMF